jgi:hypothetical protein
VVLAIVSGPPRATPESDPDSVSNPVRVLAGNRNIPVIRYSGRVPVQFRFWEPFYRKTGTGMTGTYRNGPAAPEVL